MQNMLDNLKKREEQLESELKKKDILLIGK
jgi:hypothetical protein